MGAAHLPSADGRMKMCWCLHTTESYLATEKKEILPFTTACVDLEGITLSEISQSKKDKRHVISLTCEI